MAKGFTVKAKAPAKQKQQSKSGTMIKQERCLKVRQ